MSDGPVSKLLLKKYKDFCLLILAMSQTHVKLLNSLNDGNTINPYQYIICKYCLALTNYPDSCLLSLSTGGGSDCCRRGICPW